MIIELAIMFFDFFNIMDGVELDMHEKQCQVVAIVIEKKPGCCQHISCTVCGALQKSTANFIINNAKGSARGHLQVKLMMQIKGRGFIQYVWRLEINLANVYI